MKKRILVLLVVIACLICVLALASCNSSSTGGNGGNGQKYTITFMPNGGVIEGADEDGTLTIEVYDGDLIPEPTATKADSAVLGWFKGPKESDRWVFSTMKPTSDLTLTVYWRKTACDHEFEEDATRSYPATCTTAGKAFLVCTKCGLESPETIKKLDHDLKEEKIEATCSTAPYTRTYCAREGCDYEIKDVTGVATGDHQWSFYNVLYEATSYVPGKEVRYCEVCKKEIPYVIPPLKDSYDLSKLQIGNYTYTDSKYTNEPFVNITSFGGIYATSYYSICEAKNLGDGSPDKFWCADTLADGSKYTGDAIIITFDKKYDIGAINFILPVYSSWGLGDDCYVAYDISILKDDGTWEKIDTVSDKDVKIIEVYGNLLYEFDEHITTSAIQLTVAHSSRYAPAMIYELEVMAKTNETERVSVSLNSSTTASISGRHNEYAGGADKLTDGSYTTAWQVGFDRPHNHKPDGIYAILDFSKEKFVASIQFATGLGNGKKFELYYWENEEWVKIGAYEVKSNKGVYEYILDDGEYSSFGQTMNAGSIASPSNLGLITVDLDKYTSKVKLQLTADPQGWNSYIYSFEAFTVIQQAKGEEAYTGCNHPVLSNKVDTLATCDNAGYSTFECINCGVKVRTDSVDALGHIWSEYTPIEETTAGVVALKESSCSTCQQTRRKIYTPDYIDATITQYLNNAPAAWAQTFDDGNYISTYEWLIPKLQEYNYRATAVITIGMMSGYTDNWKQYTNSGVIDLGSHSYNHMSIYSGPLNEVAILGDVMKAHYWFMNSFSGQRILGFATPNGATSDATAEYVTGIMAANRNGGQSYFINKTEELISRKKWGNLGSYISKLEQSEGLFLFVKDGKFLTDTKYDAAFNPGGTFGRVENKWDSTWQKDATVNSNGAFVYDEEGNIINPENGYIAIKLFGGYRLISLDEAKEIKPINYVYDPETNRLQESTAAGTYYYDEENYRYVWKESGSYVDDGSGKLVYDENNNNGYKLYHVALGTYEEGINKLLESGGWTIECLHGLSPSFDKTADYIQTTYTSTMRKFEYLKQTGIWVCSYTDIIQYQKEYQNADVKTTYRDDVKIELELTDTLDDIMFNHALTIKVDIPDTWENITATQNGEAIEFFIEDGFAYVNAVPDQGTIVVAVVAE